MSDRFVSSQYGHRSSAEVRSVLRTAALRFVQAARALPGVRRIALVGSFVTAKPFPKDVDVLVTVTDDMDLGELARLGRQMAGAVHAINGGADVFLSSPDGSYLGRTCPWRECGPGRRVRCGAEYQSGRLYLRDDHRAVTLPRTLIESPPVELWPTPFARLTVPQDIESLVLQLSIELQLAPSRLTPLAGDAGPA
jgi:hypothetical protein